MSKLQQWSAATDLTECGDELYRVARAALRRTLGARFVGQEDLLQAVLERVVRTVKQGRFSGECSLATWVSVIARRVAIDELRSEARGTSESGQRAAARLRQANWMLSLDVEGQLEARSTLEHVRRALEQMDGATARVLVRHFQGHDLAEIAASLGISPAAAQSRLVRGRKTLRRRLGTKLVR